MNHNIAKHFRHAALLLTLCINVPASWGLSASHFATTSKLAQGRWVKIAVPTTGVYEITAQELSQMGFSSAQSVRVWGCGGNLMSEVLDGSATDDLQQVPTRVIDGKLCFYGRGPVAVKLTGPTSTLPHYTRTVNPYSNYGYYFLTADAGNNMSIALADAKAEGTTARTTSLCYDMHEKELTSVSTTGKDLLGEDLGNDGLDFSVNVPGLVAGTSLAVNPCVAGNSPDSTSLWITTSLTMGGNTQQLKFSGTTHRIKPTTDKTYVSYVSASPTSSVLPGAPAETGTLHIGLKCDKQITLAKLDYFIVTYQRHNKLAQGESQMRMDFNQLSSTDRIEMAQDGLEVWNVDDPDAPVQCRLSESSETGVLAFTPGIDKAWAQFVAFDPKAELLHIAGWQEVPNQNIHGDSVPQMVIITNQALMDQAKRIANVHRLYEDMHVSIYDQEQIFNEFSSGTPDAMAFRMMNKMFYDRDTEGKFKYLLILGCGSYDNRGLSTNKPNRVLTYQSTASNDETSSYTSDDFFGLLDDNSGQRVNSDILRLGIGRITSATPEECKDDVDKLINYMVNPDYGVWRNNALVTADNGDRGLHQYQAEGIAQLIEDQLDTRMVANRGYNGMFPLASEKAEPGIDVEFRTAVEGGRYMKQQLNAGQYFFTYVGHSGPIWFTHDNNMWTYKDAQQMNNRHLPIMTTASCDVARYDSDFRGIAEVMFHLKNSGVIAAITSARTVYAVSNDKINRAFVNTLFSTDANGEMPRLGDAYMKCKQTFGNKADNSKMSFLMLGDPAMKANFPLPYFKVRQINGKTMTDSSTFEVMPMHKISLVGYVLDPRYPGQEVIDKKFNGTATITIYDRDEMYVSTSGSSSSTATKRNIYYPRTPILQVQAKVQAGVMRATLVLPRNVRADRQKCTVALYAHKDNSTLMVNGRWPNLIVGHYYDDASAISDKTAPEITDMYLGESGAFADGAPVPQNTTLHVHATDDVAINTQLQSVGMNMTLQLDGGHQTFPDVNSWAVCSNEGHSMQLDFPLTNLSVGEHSLTFTVTDVAGNSTSRTVNFTVQQPSKVTLSTEADVVLNEVNFTASTTDLLTEPTVAIKVTDGAGRLVWAHTTREFPCKWNLVDSTTGAKVKPGVYHYWGTYTAGSEGGGTEVGQLVVISPQKVRK